MIVMFPTKKQNFKTSETYYTTLPKLLYLTILLKSANHTIYPPYL